MKLQIFSDCHLEAYASPDYIWHYVTPQEGVDVAVVAGDIHSKHYEDAVNEIATKFKKVFCLLGNHEWYGRDISWRPDRSLLADNVTLLDRDCVEYEGVTFIGATLWTDFKNRDFFVMHNAKDHINDFRVISDGKDPKHHYKKKFTPYAAAQKHDEESAYLNLMVEQNRGKKIVVVTHFLPSYQLVHPKWKVIGSDNLNYYFSASCDDLVEKSEAAVWIFGHTHDRVDMMLGDVRCVCCPIGYPRENPNYEDMVIEI